MDQYTDTELAHRIRKGDQAAFGEVFGRYCDALVRYAHTILSNRDEAEDVVQQLFVHLWTKRLSIDVNTSIKSYLYRSVYNSSLNRIKSRKVRDMHAEHVHYQGEEVAMAASHEVERKETAAAIEKAIEELPPQCRTIFMMSRFEHQKYQQIADQLGISVKTVEVQMGKALKHMRNKLKPHMLSGLIIFLLNS